MAAPPKRPKYMIEHQFRIAEFVVCVTDHHSVHSAYGQSWIAFFSDFIGNVEIGMAKADLTIARRYAALVRDEGVRERVFGMIVEEFARTRRMILKLTGQPELLSGNPVLARSIRLRNPYVDPLSLIQCALLRRKRAGEESEGLNYALAATINGIAAGLRNTG